MRALGLRAEPKLLHWAVVEGTAEAPVLVGHDKAVPPVHVDEPEALGWYRERLKFLIGKFAIDAVGIRIAETFGRQGSLEPAMRRSRIEGVLFEGSYSCGKPVLAGALNQLSATLGSKSVKHYVDEGELRGLDFSKLPSQRKEAVLVGVAALAAGGSNDESAS